MTTKNERQTGIAGVLVEGFDDLPRWEFRARRESEKSFIVAATDNEGNRLEFVGTDHHKLKAWIHKALLEFATFGFHPGDLHPPESQGTHQAKQK